MQLIKSIPCANTLGEGVIYDEREDQLLWTDIQESKLYRYSLSRDVLEVFEMPSRVGSLALTEQKDDLLIAFEEGVARYNLETAQRHNIVELEPSIDHTRANDGRVDRQGRFWVGTMVEEHKLAPEQTDFEKACLYRIDGPGKLTPTIGDLMITNSLCWSPDGQYMYHCDTPRREINRYRVDALGLPQDGKVFASIENNGFPDGSVVDAEGYLWNAQWGASQIVRYSPAGEISEVLLLPVTQPSCVCFAGRDFDLLVVTTAREGLSDAGLANQPDAGNVLIYKTSFKGLPESRCLLN